MNRFLCCVFLFCISSVAFSQKQYFIYLQTETNQPFFVKINEKLHSSAASGYLILSNLNDSSYTFKIGFPQNKWPEQQFSVSIKSKDRGFLLKNFGEKGWGLFDLQTLTVLMAEEPLKDKSVNPAQGEISAFTEILSRAANDPSLKEKSVVLAKYEEKPVSIQPAIVKEEVRTPENPPAVNTVLTEQSAKKIDSSLANKKETVKQEDTAKLTVQATKADELLAKKPEELTTPGKPAPINTVVIEQSAKNMDSSPVTKKENIKKEDTTKFAVQQKKAEETIAKKPEELNKKIDTTSAISTSAIKRDDLPAAIKNGKNDKLKELKVDSSAIYKRSLITKRSESSTTEGFGLTFIDELTAGNRDTIQIVIPNPVNFVSKPIEPPAEQRKFLNVTSDEKDLSPIGTSAAKRACSSVASDNDFLKLRKKMAAQKTEDAMISESKKVFKSKCFTTEQVKNLGNLFLNEAGKFRFYETAYPFNSDRDNFTSLQVELKDAYFIHRFKKMLN